VLFWADEDYTTLAALGPVALTNDPAMHGVQPLAASNEPRADDRAGVSARRSDRVEDSSLRQPNADAEIALLRRQLVERDANAFVDRGMRLGKIVEATRDDWRDDFLRDATAAESKLARSPVLRPPGRVIPIDSYGRPRTIAVTRGPGESRNASSIDPADLTAYDAAVAAGRVK
jgi:hypothetical protein